MFSPESGVGRRNIEHLRESVELNMPITVEPGARESPEKAGATGGIEDALRVGLYMVRGPAATSRLRADPAQEPKVLYLAKGTVPDHGEERGSSGHRDDDYLEWVFVARTQGWI